MSLKEVPGCHPCSVLSLSLLGPKGPNLDEKSEPRRMLYILQESISSWESLTHNFLSLTGT